jgi:hypothetical protein
MNEDVEREVSQEITKSNLPPSQSSFPVADDMDVDTYVGLFFFRLKREAGKDKVNAVLCVALWLGCFLVSFSALPSPAPRSLCLLYALLCGQLFADEAASPGALSDQQQLLCASSPRHRTSPHSFQQKWAP